MLRSLEVECEVVEKQQTVTDYAAVFGASQLLNFSTPQLFNYSSPFSASPSVSTTSASSASSSSSSSIVV